jgi:hypothetical protein
MAKKELSDARIGINHFLLGPIFASALLQIFLKFVFANSDPIDSPFFRIFLKSLIFVLAIYIGAVGVGRLYMIKNPSKSAQWSTGMMIILTLFIHLLLIQAKGMNRDQYIMDMLVIGFSIVFYFHSTRYLLSRYKSVSS